MGKRYGKTGRENEADEALNEGEERYRRLVESSPDAVAVHDGQRILYANAAAARFFGAADPEELVGRAVLGFVHPDDRETVASRVRAILEGGEGAPLLEERYLRLDGGVVDAEVAGQPITYEGRPAVQAILRDVTERKRAEEKLRESEGRFRQLFEQAVDTLLVHDETGRIVDCNAEACRSLGYSREEMLSLCVNDFAENLSSGEGRASESGPLWRRDAESRGFGAPAEGVHLAEHRRKDGTTFPVEVRVGLIDYGGERMMLASCRDVTELKRAAEALKESEERFRSLVQNASDVVTVLDAEGAILYESPSVERVLGYRPEELVGESAFYYVHPDDRGRVLGAFAEGSKSPGTTFTPLKYRFRHKDGSWRCLESVNNNLLSDPKVRGMVVNSRDVTERVRAEEELRRSEANLADAQRLAHLGSFEVDLRTGRGRWSEESWRIFGLTPRRGETLSQEEFERFVHPDDREAVRRAVDGAAIEGRGFETTCRIIRPGGSERTVHARAEVVLDDAGRPALLRGTNHDVTERKALEERLEHQAFHDPLTGLPNRSLLMDRLTHAFSRAERREGAKVAVLFFDLDDFKYVNDTLGHGAGDRLLAAAAGRLEGCVRPGDTVARLGGDEFAVLLEDAEGTGEAVRVAERAVGALRDPFDLGGREVFCGTSVGVALGAAGDPRGRPEDLLRKADLALYEAKRGGKARHAVFDPGAERRAVRRLELENGLRRALERDELVVLYQPVVALDTGRTVGFEALVRWEHPERGLVPPCEFVPLAEENGLIVPIGRRVLREACRRVRDWQDRYPSRPPGPPLIVGVNLSARQLSHPDLLADVEEALAEARLDPAWLTLEITESAVVGNEERHVDALRKLKDLGVRLAIDDFGTGYSSLSYLRRLPVGMLKIDRSFVEGIGRDGAEENEVVLSGVVGIAHGLGLRVLAEGVETPEQLARLKTLGCDLAQGHLFSGPLSGGAASRFLAVGAPN